MKAGSQRESYRVFRSRVLGTLDAQAWPAQSFARRRALLLAYRAELIGPGSHWLDAGYAPHLRHALGIPAGLVLDLDKWQRRGQLLLLFLPIATRLRKAAAMLEPVRTFEGRQLVFARLIAHWFSLYLGVDKGYSAELDLVIRKLVPPASHEQFKQALRIDAHWLKAAARLGRPSLKTLLDNIARYYNPTDGLMARLLVEEGAIRSFAELRWVREIDRETYHSRSDTDPEYARQIIRLLLSHGVERALVADLRTLQFNINNVTILRATLALLAQRGVGDLSLLFGKFATLLCSAPVHRWQFLTDVLHVRSASELVQFDYLLQAGSRLSHRFAAAITDLGATIDDLIVCQRLLHRAGQLEDEQPALDALALLSAAPFSLDFSQLAQAQTYLFARRNLGDFLQVLTLYGYGNSESALAFQTCFEAVDATTLNELLHMTQGRGVDQDHDALAEWVKLAGSTHSIETYCYLIDTLQVSGITQLHQLLSFGPLGHQLCRYAIEERGLTTLRQLVKWRQSARGIVGFRLHHAPDDIDRVMLEDAFRRNRFDLFEGNLSAIYQAVSERADTRLGNFPFMADEYVRQHYHAQRRVLMDADRQQLLPLLPYLLENRGILLFSLMEHAWGPREVLEQQLQALTPLLEELASGAGPQTLELSRLQVDAIALTYSTTPQTVESNWPKVANQTSALTSDMAYPMTWKRVQREQTAAVDRSGLSTIQDTAQAARRFASLAGSDMFEACKHMQPKRLVEAAEIAQLVPHMAVLLHIASPDQVVAAQVKSVFSGMTHVVDYDANAYQQTHDLRQFFDVILLDAINTHSPAFVRKLNEADAAHLASRLSRNKSLDHEDGHSRLKHAIGFATERVLKVYGRWAQRELKKFSELPSRDQNTHLQAFVSKHPAAFFARQAVNLCTKDNIAMWQETRHAHLVIFDKALHSFAGMALLYVEIIEGVHSSVPCLVIRAINPVNSLLSEHSVASMVDACFDVATRIARQHQLAGVVFPDPGGMHLMSNLYEVEKDIKTRYIGRYDDTGKAVTSRRKPARPITARFYAYETGSTPVNRLYLVWSNEASPVRQDHYAHLD